MKLLRGRPFDQWRQDRPGFGSGGDRYGDFLVPLPSGVKLFVIASDGFGWDHVSVTVRGAKRCPTWEEMSYIKRAFFERDEWALELHPPQAHNISEHDYCLHLWRCQYAEPELPMPILVGKPRGAQARS